MNPEEIKGAKKNLEAKATLTEPKDEINLKQPNVKEVSAETEVNSVGEYVYDTKLDKDDIHKEFWKKLKDNFKGREKNLLMEARVMRKL